VKPAACKNRRIRSRRVSLRLEAVLFQSRGPAVRSPSRLHVSSLRIEARHESAFRCRSRMSRPSELRGTGTLDPE
jgi:hypothetical protein